MVRYDMLESIGTKRTGLAARNSRSSTSSGADRRPRRAGHWFVICIDNRNYTESLERRKIDRTVEDVPAARHGLIRVFDESGESYLYSRDRFVPVTVPVKARKAFRTS